MLQKKIEYLATVHQTQLMKRKKIFHAARIAKWLGYITIQYL